MKKKQPKVKIKNLESFCLDEVLFHVKQKRKEEKSKKTIEEKN